MNKMDKTNLQGLCQALSLVATDALYTMGKRYCMADDPDCRKLVETLAMAARIGSTIARYKADDVKTADALADTSEKIIRKFNL